jgi:hypothetical protein
VLIAVLAMLAAAPEPEPACFAAAKALVARVEAMPMPRRRAAIDLAFRRDPSLLCGVVDAKFFAAPVEPPAGCTRAACVFPKGIEVAPELAADAGFELYVRVETLAVRLREAGKLSAAHERLLSIWLLSAAIVEREH